MRLACLALSLVLSSILVTSAVAAETVPTAHFNGVGLQGGGSVTIRPAATQRVIIHRGSTAYTRIRVRDGSLEIDNCFVRCPAGYRLDVEIQTPNLNSVAVSAGGTLRFLPGFAAQRSMSAAVASGGQIDMKPLRAADVSAAVSSGGRIHAGTPQRLSAVVSSGGSVRYSGNPAVSSMISSGGSVSRDN